MWSLQNFLFILCTALCCVCGAAGLIRVFGYEGRDVQVPCGYYHGYEDYEKYLCKSDCDYSDVRISTSMGNKTKYFIYDDRKTKIFTVTVSNLSVMDAGRYWCGVTRTGKDIYTEVKLEIRQDSCCDEVNKIQSHEEASVSISCPYESQDANKLKYMCRGKQPATCLQQAVISSRSTQNRRFTLTDDNMSRFTVNINSLTLEDSGSYLCGVHRDTGFDVFSAVELQVKEWCCVRSENMRGIVGRPVTLQCPYPPHHQNNSKFLCKGDERSSCRDMMSQSRFTLHNVSSTTFLVTITELEAADAGTYWCGSHSQWSVGNYTSIHLSVVYQQETSTVETFSITSHAAGKPSKDAALYVILSVPAVLLLIMTSVLLVVYKHKRCRDGGNKLKTVDSVVVSQDIYGNHDAVVMHSKINNCPQSDADDQPDYENVTSEQIYNNEF